MWRAGKSDVDMTMEPDVELADDLPLTRIGGMPVTGEVHAGIVMGELIGLVDDGTTPLVRYAGQPGTRAIRAQTLVALNAAWLGRRVALMFEGGDGDKPIVVGAPLERATVRTAAVAPVQIEADDSHVIVRASERLVLRCGEASIVLTCAGKILLQGTYVSSRSSGVNRVQGGSVQIN